VTEDRRLASSSDDAPTQAVAIDGVSGQQPTGEREADASLFSGSPEREQPDQGSVRLSEQPEGAASDDPTRVLSAAELPQGGPARTVPMRPTGPTRQAVRPEQRVASRAPARRRARLALKRIDPWSVFVLAFLVSLFFAVVLLVAVFALYALLDSLGVLSAVDDFARDLEVVDAGQSLLGLGRVLVITGTIAIIDIVLLTVLATLGAFLYNLCASLTGGVEVVLAERD